MAQYNKATQSLLADSKTLYEVVMLADKEGNVTSTDSGIYVEYSGASADAFGRGRVSQPQTLGDYKNSYSDDLNDFHTISTSGGAVTYNSNEANAVLSTNTTASSSVIHQTKRYHHYLPGKSQLIFSSFCFNSVENSSKKRIGYYDDKNGVFFEQEVDASGTSTLKFVIRSNVSGSVVDTEVTQENWNTDKCDADSTTFEFDSTKTQLFFVDFQWLGVGRVRCGFVHNGKLIVAHQFLHSNIIANVYWSNPSLPVRSEVLNTAINSSASMQMICSTVMSEGGYIEAGIDWEAQNSVAKATATPGGTWTPIIAVRLKNTFKTYENRVLFKAENISVFADNNSIAYKIGKINSASSLSGSLVWNNVNADSACEYCTNATAITYADFISFGGGFVASGVSTGSQSSSSPSTLTESRRNLITQNYDSTDSEVFVVLAKTLSTGVNDSANVFASIQWKEII